MHSDCHLLGEAQALAVKLATHHAPAGFGLGTDVVGFTLGWMMQLLLRSDSETDSYMTVQEVLLKCVDFPV